MNNNYPHLFSPVRVGKLTFRNRILAVPGSPVLDHQSSTAFYENKARGGAACVTLGEHAVSSKYPVGPPGASFSLTGCEGEPAMPAASVVARAIKSYGAFANVQLNHHGEFYRFGGTPPIGPTARINKDGLDSDGHQVVEMNEDMIEEAIEDFAKAAFTAKKFGFDMVQLHGGHGWLLAQFLSPYFNKRKDRWGGSLENRARFPMEVINRIRKKCGRDFPIEYRISGDELVEGGMKIDETVEFVKMIEDSIDLIHVSAGVHFIFRLNRRVLPIIAFEKPGCNVYLAAEMKKHVKIPVLTLGGINTPEHAEQILAEGKADIIGMGRELICDPDFPNKAREGRRDEIIPCMRCQSCVNTQLPWSNFAFACSANPRVGADVMLSRIGQPKASRKVVVVGGGPAGMTAAITAAERGHQVTVLEKSSALGGLLKTMDFEPAKWEVKRYKDFLVDRTCKTVNDVRLNTEATPELLEKLNPDVVIAAAGSRFFIPNLPGVDKDTALTALDVYYHPEKIGQSVVMVGGGTTACEASLFLANEGKKVTIVEMREELGNLVENGLYQWPLTEEIEKEPNISFKLQAKCMGVAPKGVTVEVDGKQEFIPADSVVFCVGLIPEAATVDMLRNCGSRFCSVGDCVSPKNIMQATRTAFFSAMNIL